MPKRFKIGKLKKPPTDKGKPGPEINVKKPAYKPGSKPDPAFVNFFNGEFSRRLNETSIPGMDEPSWDRRAAYLLWISEKKAI